MEKLISIVWYKVLPAVFGGQKGIAGFQQHLAQHFPLTCLCSVNNEQPEDLSYKVIPVLPAGKKQFADPVIWRRIENAARREAATYIVLEHPYHGIAAYRAKKATGARLIVHSHNIESERFRQLGKYGWQLLRKYEGWIHRHADLSLFKTPQDLEWAMEHYRLKPSKCMLLPYGVDKPAINNGSTSLVRQRHGLTAREKLLLFAGTLDYAPNATAVKSIFHHLIPALDKQEFTYKIIICGRNRNSAFRHRRQLSHPSVIFAGEVADIANYFGAADAFINPVQFSSGIQTKTLDAIAHGCPVICFEQQAAGIAPDICGNKLLLATNGNWDNFAAMIQRAVNMREPTPESFFNYFDWDNILAPLIHRIRNWPVHENKNAS